MRPSLRLLLTGSAFSPERLFRSGEQGFYFDPADPTTAYQDSAGTTAGVVAQPVGLRLDKRLGAVRGAELNDTGTWGAAPAGVTTNPGAGTATFAGTQAAFAAVNINGAVGVANQFYEILFTVSGLTQGGVQVKIGSATSNFVSANGSYRLWFMATAATTAVIQENGSAGSRFIGTVSGISIKAVPGSHATQSTSASRPVWAQDGFGFFRDTFDGFDDSLTIAAGGGSTTGFFYCAAINVAGGAGTARTIISDTGTNAGYRLRINATNQLELAAGNGVAFTSVATVATLSVGSTYVVTAWDDGVNLNVQVNQGAVASVARPAVSAGTSSMTEGKDNGAASSFANAGLYSRVYRAGTVPDATQRAQLQRFNASRAGVTL